MKNRYMHGVLFFSFIIVLLSGCSAVPKPPMKRVHDITCVNVDNNDTTKIRMYWIKPGFQDAKVKLAKDPWDYVKEAVYSDNIHIKDDILVASKDSSFAPEILGFNWRNSLFAEDTLVLDGQENLVIYGKTKYVCKKGELSKFISKFDTLQKYINDWNIKNNK